MKRKNSDTSDRNRKRFKQIPENKIIEQFYLDLHTFNDNFIKSTSYVNLKDNIQHKKEELKESEELLVKLKKIYLKSTTSLQTEMFEIEKDVLRYKILNIKEEIQDCLNSFDDLKRKECFDNLPHIDLEDFCISHWTSEMIFTFAYIFPEECELLQINDEEYLFIFNNESNIFSPCSLECFPTSHQPLTPTNNLTPRQIYNKNLEKIQNQKRIEQLQSNHSILAWKKIQQENERIEQKKRIKAKKI